jgi:type III secretion protein U
MGEKTEKASPKKMKDARKKGQVAKSQDLPAAFTFIVSIWATLGMCTILYGYLSGFLVETFRLVSKSNLDSLLGGIWTEAIYIIFIASMPVMVVVCAIGVLVNFLAVGPVFSMEVFKFDIKKFDPIQNLKGKFKLKTLVELLKSCLKIGIASYIIYLVMYNSLPVLIQSVAQPMSVAIMIFYTFMMEVVIKVGIFFIVVAVADFVYQRKSFASEMKMEKFEVKQEYKNTEGDPHIKGKRRQIAQELAYSDGPSGGVKQASAVVTNPTHLAIAIGYDSTVDAAPYIVGMGQDALAERMISIAKQYDIPIVRNIKLARDLWDNGEVYEFVPENTYEALAEILRWIASLNTEEAFDYVEKTTE